MVQCLLFVRTGVAGPQLSSTVRWLGAPVLLIRTEQEAADFVNSVHQLHDGFIRYICLRSHDTFEIRGDRLEDVSHTCTGEFDAEIEFVPHPTIGGLPLAPGLVRCLFKNVSEFCLDLRNVRSHEWPIHEIRIERCSESSRLKLDCTWNRLNEREEWFLHTVHLLSFEELVVDQP